MFPPNLEKEQTTVIIITCPQVAEHCAGQLKFFIQFSGEQHFFLFCIRNKLGKIVAFKDICPGMLG